MRNAFGLIVLLSLGASAVASSEQTADRAALRNETFAAYNDQDYVRAAAFAARYIDGARAAGRSGREVAAIAFVLGHSRFELHRMSDQPYAGDYRSEVIEPLEESLQVLQDDPAFKNMLLGNAYYELWTLTGRRDSGVEARAHWHLMKSILTREMEVADRRKDDSEYELFARHLLFYLERCLDLARDSATPDDYVQRIRATAPLGFGTAYDARFLQIYDLTYFDGGNMKAAAFWQRGLDSMREPDTSPDETIAILRRAADLTQRRADRAEVYRQMSDYVSTIDTPERRSQAVEYAREAYKLDPDNTGIRAGLGSGLHVLSYGAYTAGHYESALEYAREAIAFEWDGMEVALFDLSRAAAEMGHEAEALEHGGAAYRLAKERLAGAELQPFAQNYVNILRQFGESDLAEQILREGAVQGVR